MLSRLRAGLAVRRALVCVTLGVLLLGGVPLPAWSAPGHAADADPPAAEVETPAQDEPPSKDEPAEDEEPAEEPLEPKPDEPEPESDEPESDDEAPAQIGPQTVPPANGNNAVITVKVAGDRTSLTGVGPLAGVQLGFFYTETGDTAAFTCTSDADGDCSITVPNAHLTINQGGNRDRRFWVRQVGAAPGHYDNLSLGVGSTVSSTSYRFQTGNRLRAGGTYRSTDDFMIDTGTNNNTASSGIWQNSRSNSSFPAKCGINVALVLDLSGSVGSDLPNLKSAANTFVNSLSGTPSAVSVFTFATSAPAAGGSNGTLPLTSVSTPAGAATVTSKINGLALGTGNEAGTNWDRGLYQVAQSTARFDVAVVITDGNPTFYSAAEGPGDRTRFREVEHGVFSANAIKAEGTKVIAFGVGGGIGNTGSGQNLRAISGPTLNTDYYQTTDYQAAGEQLRALALGNCAGSITVVKQVVPSTTAPGSTTGATPQGGWTFTGAGSTGITFDAPNVRDTAPITGAANFPLSFAGGTTTGPVTLTETLRDGYSLHQGVIGQNAVCRRLDTGANLAVTNAGSLGFTVGTSVDYSVSCTVYNRAADVDASVVLEKTWRVNGTTYADGDQPSALAATGSIDGTDQPFGQPRGGFAQGDTVSLDESLGRMPAQCTLDSSRLTSANGTAVDLPLPASRTLAAGSNAFEITNVVTCPTLLTLDKTVRHGPASPSEWTLDALAPDGALPGPVGVAGSPEATGVPVTPGVTYPLAESGGPLEYVQFTAPNAVLIAGATGSWNCQEVDRDGTTVLPGFADGLNGGVRVPFGSWVRCTAANESAMIRLVKEVSNDHGGTAVPSDWDLVATPTGAGSAGLPEIRVPGADLADAEILQVRPGVSYELSEEGGPDGYELASIECEITQPRADAASVALAPGERATCWFVNEDRPAQLTLVKEVVNEHGGTAEATAWTLSADGPTPISGVTGSDDVTTAPVLPGDYDLSEAGGPAGYTASDWNCGPADLDGSTVTVPLGKDVTCTIVNTDQAAQLTLVKEVVNEHGGTAEATAWTLSADGPTPISGATGSDEVTAATVDAGSYELAEEGPAGYRASDWDCGLAELDDETVRVPNGGDVTCTITNAAVAPTLTLVKEVVNEHGGTAVPTEWTLTADGPSPISGITGSDEVTGVVVQTGDYDLSEAGPTGYTASDWDCGPAELDGSTVSVPLDEDVTCTIVNTDQPAQLTLIKVVDNGDTGDTAVPADFTLTAEPRGIDGQPTVSGHGDPDLPGGVKEEVVFSGDYLLSEDGPIGFEGSIWECTGGGVVDETVTVPNGGNVTCTITNTAVAPTLTLVKEVVNEHGGTAEATEWILTADGPSPISGATGDASVTSAPVQIGDYDLSEAGPSGYTASDWDCGPAELDGSTVTVPRGGDVTCTIVNTDQAAQLTLVKEVVNDNGGTAEATEWTLSADGPTPLSGATGSDDVTAVNVDAGSYELAEAGPAGYAASDWDCGAAVVTGSTVAVPPGGNVTCTIVNDDRPAQLTLVKEVVNDNGGTAVPTDWTLSADGPTPISGATGSDDVTAATVNAGSYNLSEAGPGGYRASDWECGPAELAGSTVTVPSGGDVTCTIVNNDRPTWSVLKESDPESGSTVEPGDEITYTVWLIRGEGVDDPRNVTVNDDLGDVLNHATLVDGPTSSVGDAVVDGDTLTWTVPVLSEERASVTYTARVDDDAWGVTLRNVVTSPGSTTCPPPEGESARAAGALVGPATLAGVLSNAEDDQCSTTHPTPAWELEKSSDPASGSTVQPGSKVTYTLWVTNTSDAVVANAVVTDDLSDVLKHARLDAVPDGATLKKKTLTWEVPGLDPGESVSLSYTVTVDKDAHDVSFGNVATPGDGGECPEVCTTTHETPPEPVDPTPPTTPAPPSPWLPNTGGPGLLVLMLGGGLLVLGSGLVYAARRRRQVVVPE